MSASWRDEEEELRAGGARGGGGLKAKPRFSFTEVKLLLEAVKRNRYIILRKFNLGVSAEAKKKTWAEITEQVNGLGENHREVRQIMKKWADLKCDGKRRIVALRGPNGSNLRKKNLGPVERMVHKILMMSPRGDGESDPEFGEDEDLYSKGPVPYSYLHLTDTPFPLGGGASTNDISPLSSPEKDLGGETLHSSSDFDPADEREHMMDFEENDSSLYSSSYPEAAPPAPCTSLDPLPDDALLRVKPLHTYSRNSTSSKPSSSSAEAEADAPPPEPPGPAPSDPSDPLPRAQDHVAQLAHQSVQQQRAGRALLGSVSRSLEALAGSLQLLVETQQEFVQEALLLQRETVDVLRDFSSTALSMLRDKGGLSRSNP